jgi:hypothetical protein
MNRRVSYINPRYIEDQYRELLKKPKLGKGEVEALRSRVQQLARTICEYVWKKNFF